MRSGALDGVGEIFRRLRAGDNETAAEDEAWHAVDAGFLSLVRFVLDAIHVGIAGERAAHQVAVHAAIAAARISVFESLRSAPSAK